MWFGEFEVHKNMKRLFSCLAKTEVELFVIEKKHFKQIFFKSFPGFGKYFVYKIDQNFEKLENTMQVILNYIFPETVDKEIAQNFRLIQSEAKEVSKLNQAKSPDKQGTFTSTDLIRDNGEIKQSKSGSRVMENKMKLDMIQEISKHEEEQSESASDEKDSESRELVRHSEGSRENQDKIERTIREISSKLKKKGQYQIIYPKMENSNDYLSNYDFKETFHRIKIPKTPLMQSNCNKQVKTVLM